MKKRCLLLFLVLAVILLGIFAACKKKENDKDNKPSSSKAPWTEEEKENSSSSSDVSSDPSTSNTNGEYENSDGSSSSSESKTDTSSSQPDEGFMTTSNQSVPKNPFPSSSQVNVTQEISLTGSAAYDTPYSQVVVNAVFTGPNGQKVTVPGFWDGEKTWKIRFAAPVAGNWSYVTECSNTSDTGLHNKTGTLSAVEYTGDDDILKHGRLRVNDAKDGLTYSDGTPFFWLADTHWFAASMREKLYFSNNAKYESMFKGTVNQRAAEGYTAYQFVVNVSSGEGKGNDNEGGAPWTGKIWQDMNTAYWQNVDERVEYLVSKGIVPVIGLEWGGNVFDANLDDYKQISRYLIARYSSYPIVWFVVGEYNNTVHDAVTEVQLYNYGKIGQYFSNTDPYDSLVTVHGCYKVNETYRYSVDYFRGQEWFDFVMSEGGHINTWDAPQYSDWAVYENDTYKIPWLEAEAKYEDIWEIPPSQTREIAYLSILSGSFGYSYGSEGGWQSTWNSQDMFQTYGRLPTPWFKALNKVVGSTQLTYMKNLFTSLPWWRLKADTKTIDWNYETKPLTVLQPTVKATEDKDWIVIYYPMNNVSENYTLYPDFKGIAKGLDSSSTYSAYWFYPITGKYITISKNIKADGGSYQLPQPEGLSKNDRVLIFRKNGTASLKTELFNAAANEDTSYSVSTGEKSLPETEKIPENVEVVSFNKVYGTQGQNNFYYYSYDKLTRVYHAMAASELSKTYNWGDYVWGLNAEPLNLGTEGFITDNLICSGPNQAACMMWVAPADGKVTFDSRPMWRDLWNDSDGAIFTIMHNDTVISEFKFNASTYITDSYSDTITVKKGDAVSISSIYNGFYGVYANQLQINTTMKYIRD